MENNCIFCKIANGEIPSATLYEDEEFRVILIWVYQDKRTCPDPSEGSCGKYL